MVKENTHPNARPIVLNGKGEEAFLLIHGYTGSPTDFNGLSHFLYEERGASVYVPLLPGHGTVVEDLRGLSKDVFIQAVEDELNKLLEKYPKVVVGGHSFGGQLALWLASKYPVSGVFITATPVRVAFPLSLPGLYKLWEILGGREFYRKSRSETELRERKKANAFSYDLMPAYGLKLILDINKDLKNKMTEITSPILSVYLRGDGIAHSDSWELIHSLAKSEMKKNIILDSLEHAAYFSEHAHDIYREITQFFRK